MTSQSPETTSKPTMPRRQVVLASGVAVAAVAVTAACGTSGGTGASSAASSSAPNTPSSTPPSDGPTIQASSSAPAGPGIAVADVPVGGGVVLSSVPVVVTQPTAGVFKAFSAVCTHQGCMVAGVEGGVIVCPCHNSTFSITDGSVQGGPANAPLPEVAASVAGGQVTVSS